MWLGIGMRKVEYISPENYGRAENRIVNSGYWCSKCGAKLILLKVYKGRYFIDAPEEAYEYCYKCPRAKGVCEDSALNFGHDSESIRADGVRWNG